MKSTYRVIIWLSIFTIVYNLAEGLISVLMGGEGENLSLFGFGVDSFIEALSGAGILLMVRRIEISGESSKSQAEELALKITGVAFYILATGLILGVGLNLYFHHNPTESLPGVIISSVSIAVMIFLYRAKLKTGKALNSDAIIADARCTVICIYMSGSLLVSNLLFHFFQIGIFDDLGACLIAYFSMKEGKECFDKAAGHHACHH